CSRMRSGDPVLYARGPGKRFPPRARPPRPTNDSYRPQMTNACALPCSGGAADSSMAKRRASALRSQQECVYGAALNELSLGDRMRYVRRPNFPYTSAEHPLTLRCSALANLPTTLTMPQLSTLAVRTGHTRTQEGE